MATVSEPLLPPLQRSLHPLAGVLSYLVPGLGQIVQGRVGKGLLFLVCIYTLFFYGLYLGTVSVTVDNRPYHVTGNVFLPNMPAAAQPNDPQGFQNERQSATLAHNLYNRPQFAGQFWVGVAAWPAILQYLRYDRHEANSVDQDLARLYANLPKEDQNDPEEAAKTRAEIAQKEATQRHPVLGDFMREPSERALNAVHNAGDRRLDLAWVYTVIAGVLNIMVIYDAVAGAAYASTDE